MVPGAGGSQLLAVFLAVVCISSSGAIDELQDQSEEMIMRSIQPFVSGNLQSHQNSKSSKSPMMEHFTTINNALKSAEASQVAGLMEKHFTPNLQNTWSAEVKAKKLDKDTAEGVLNSYLCSSIKDPSVLVSVIEWVRKKGAAGALTSENSGAEVAGAKSAAEKPEKQAAESSAEKPEKQAAGGSDERQKLEVQAAQAKDEKKINGRLAQKVASLKTEVESQKAKTAEEKEKSKQAVKKAEEDASNKASAAVKAVQAKTKKAEQKADKQQESAEDEVQDATDKAQAAAEKKVAKVKKDAAKKVNKASDEAEEAKEKEAKAVKKAVKAQATAKKVVEKTAEKKESKQESTSTDTSSSREKKATKKQESEIEAAEAAAVTKLKSSKSPKSFDKSTEAALQKTEELAEVKTVAMGKMMAEAKSKVSDANEILEHATKLNKFVAKSDELLRIAKMNQEQVRSEAKKEEAATEAAASELQKLRVGRAKAKLAKIKLVLENAVKDAHHVVHTEESRLDQKQSELSSTRESLSTAQQDLEKYKGQVAEKRQQMSKTKALQTVAEKNLSRAQAGARLAQQSEIAEAIRIASSMVSKRTDQVSSARKEQTALKTAVASDDKEISALTDSVQLNSARESSLIKEVAHLNTHVIPKSVKVTKQRIQAIEASMGPAVNKILETLHASQKVPKSVLAAQSAVGAKPKNAPLETQLQQEMAKRKAAEADARTLQNEISGMKQAQAQAVKAQVVDSSSAPTEQEPVNVTRSLKSVAQAQKKSDDVTNALKKMKSMITQVEDKKKQLMANLTGSAPQSAHEVKTMNHLQQTNIDLRKLKAADTRLQKLAVKRTANVASLSAAGVHDEKAAASQEAETLTAKAKVASLNVLEVKADIHQGKKDESDLESQAQTIQGKIMQTKLLINAAGSGDAAHKALAKLEGFENEAASLKLEEAEIRKKLQSEDASVGVQEAAIEEDNHKASDVMSKATEAETNLLTQEDHAKSEHKEFAKSADLVVAQATAATEKHLRQKIETTASASVAKAEKKVADLKARLTAASEAAASVSDSTKKFLESESSKPDSSESGDIQAEKAAISLKEKQLKQLGDLEEQAAGKLSTVKAELKLAQTSKQSDAIQAAKLKVTQYTNDMQQIKDARQKVAAGKVQEEKQLASLEKVKDVEKFETKKVAAFQSQALKKWGEVHKLAYDAAKGQIKQVDQLKKTVEGAMLHEHEIALTKDEEIQKLKLALNLATNPAEQKVVHKVESKEQQLNHELKRSTDELHQAEAHGQDLRHLIAKAADEKDQHNQIIYGAEAQDLAVSIKRGKLHTAALQVALKQAQTNVNDADKHVEHGHPASPATASDKQSEEEEAPQNDVQALEDKLRVEREKLTEAKQEDAIKKSKQQEAKLKLVLAQRQQEEENLTAHAARPSRERAGKQLQKDKQVEVQASSPSAQSEPQSRAEQVKAKAEQMLVAGKKSSEVTHKAAAEKDTPATQLGESDSQDVEDKRALLLKAELQLKKQQSMLLKVESGNNE